MWGLCQGRWLLASLADLSHVSRKGLWVSCSLIFTERAESEAVCMGLLRGHLPLTIALLRCTELQPEGWPGPLRVQYLEKLHQGIEGLC